MDEAFYGTLPQDTQDFTQILRGVKRNLTDAARGVSYYPYDLIGAPVDIINMALTPVGLGSQQPVLGSDYLRNIAKSLGLAQDPTGSVAETTARIGAGFINPATAARTVGQIPQQVTKAANISADKLVQMITRNPEATAPQVLQETSMPFLNAVAPKAPSLLQPQKSDLGFYSQLEAATIPLQNKGTGEQYLAQISKAPGVKPEELQWTGLDEFLKNRQSVTKAEIQDYLNANRVDVQEVRLGGMSAEQTALRNQAQNRYFEITGAIFDTKQKVEQGLLSADEGRSILSSLTAERSGLDQIINTANRSIKTKFGSYTLPGGENYREILLTLPTSGSGGKRVRVYTQDGTSAVQVMSDADIQRMAESGRRRFEVLDEVSPQGTFQSSHFDQPNILAHMRANDRVVDGKNTLFIEEIQSDWHQAGRKRGYQGQTRSVEQIDKELDSVVNELRSMPGVAYAPSAEDWARYPEITARHDALVAERASAGSSRDFVPDAPFKTSWHELALKRAIQEASEKGYDQIAFTTGKTQAERYDLSKQIKTIVYGEPDEAGRRTVRAITPNGDQLLGGKYTMSEIEDNIGKEMAEKIQKSTGEFDQRTGTYAMSGLDLQVGGEGMKGFYDNILPKSLDKLGKKFGAKVGKTEMDGVEVWTMPITPEMRQSVTTKGQPLFAIPAIGTGLLGSQVMQEDQY